LNEAYLTPLLIMRIGLLEFLHIFENSPKEKHLPQKQEMRNARRGHASVQRIRWVRVRELELLVAMPRRWRAPSMMYRP